MGKEISVRGRTVDHFTRCVHYHDDVDIVAIKFPCCDTFYPCYQCHDEVADHKKEKWPKSAFKQQAILCGNCRVLLSINEYLTVNHCPSCKHTFNENCALHYPIYFQMTEEK